MSAHLEGIHGSNLVACCRLILPAVTTFCLLIAVLAAAAPVNLAHPQAIQRLHFPPSLGRAVQLLLPLQLLPAWQVLVQLGAN